MIRPEVAAALRRWAEVGVALGLAAVGLLWALGGGYVRPVLGGAVAALGLGWALVGFRRLRFEPRGEGDPGAVQVEEGRITYFAPGGRAGGEVHLPDLTELRLVTHRGRRLWALSERGGRRLFIPVAAAGAGGLFDAFASLPGLGPGALARALAEDGAPGAAEGRRLPAASVPAMRLVWRRGEGPGIARRDSAGGGSRVGN
jgi:hypothetical protein